MSLWQLCISVCISLVWLTTAAEAIGFVGIRSCVAWFMWHTDKDAFANALRLCMHMPVHCAGHVCSRAGTSPLNCAHMPDVYRRTRGRHRQMFQYNVNTAKKDRLNMRVCVQCLESKMFSADAYVELLHLMMESQTNGWQVQDARPV